VTTLQHIPARAFWTVLVEAGAATTVVAVAAACQRHRTAGSQDKKSNREKCREVSLHERSLVSCGCGSPDRAHRPELHSIQCKRIERRALFAERVCDVPEVVGEVLVFV
jgi:hypothetical protein